MPAQLPTSRPKATLADVEKWIQPYVSQLRKTDAVICAMFRGYYLNTMGKPGENDLNMYDDAAAWIAINGSHFSMWNHNTDPTRYGWNAGAGKYMARLKPGIYRFQKWKHKGQYAAFGQADNWVTVERIRQDGTIAVTERGVFGINNHKGGQATTSSEGCLTCPQSQWIMYQKTGYDLLDRFQPTDSYPLILV